MLHLYKRFKNNTILDMLSVFCGDCNGIKGLHFKKLVELVVQELDHYDLANDNDYKKFYADLKQIITDYDQLPKKSKEFPLFKNPNTAPLFYPKIILGGDHRLLYRELLLNRIEQSNSIKAANDLALFDSFPEFHVGEVFKINIPCAFHAAWLIDNNAPATVVAKTAYGYLITVPDLNGQIEYNPYTKKHVQYTEYYMMPYTYLSGLVEKQTLQESEN